MYEAALTKLNEGSFERNLLDDLRLSFELLLKSILNNDKGLENQIPELGKYLKTSGTSPELNNMLRTIIDYFSKYHNTYIKHDDSVKENEVSLMVNLTSSFINFFIGNKIGTTWQ